MRSDNKDPSFYGWIYDPRSRKWYFEIGMLEVVPAGYYR